MMAQQKKLFSLAILLTATLFVFLLSGPQTAASEKPDFLDPEYIRFALQGDLSSMEMVLSARERTTKNVKLLEKFRARFFEESDSLVLSGEDPLVQNIGELYQEYWRNALLTPEKRENLEGTLNNELIVLLQKEGISSAEAKSENHQDLLLKILRAKGYDGIFGRTFPLLEFMVWKTNDKKVHSVELTDGVFELEVNYLKDFVSRGWSSFATFGGPSTGGWATPEGLFVVGGKWNLESEAFRISYLKHETRHFADYIVYPNLAGPDLEYRAKLTELTFVVEDMAKLLTMFTNHAAKVNNSPHSLANWYVITNMSRELLGNEWPENPEAWKAISISKIQATAKKLLVRHSQILNEEGAETTTGVIKPE